MQNDILVQTLHVYEAFEKEKASINIEMTLLDEIQY